MLDLIGGVACALPGVAQTVPRAELFALLLVLNSVSDHVHCISDSLLVVNGLQRILGQVDDSPLDGANHDLWAAVYDAVLHLQAIGWLSGYDF